MVSSAGLPDIYMTGANGFVGQELLRFFEAKSITVVRLRRDANAYWHIPSHLAGSTDSGSESYFLIHLAVPKRRANRRDWDRYHQRTQNLFYQARRAGVTIIQISSMSAHSNNPSLYSEQKQVSENLARDYGGIVVRLGIIETMERRSPYRRLNTLLKVFPLSLFLAPGVNLLLTNALMLRQFVGDLISGRITETRDVSYGRPIFSTHRSSLRWRKLVSGPISAFLSSGRRRFPESEFFERATNLYFGMQHSHLQEATPFSVDSKGEDAFRRGYRFLVVGIINTAIYASLLFSVTAAGAPLAVGNATSFSIAALSSYAMNSGYVFQTKFTGLGAVNFLGTLTVLMASIGYLGAFLGLRVWQVGAISATFNIVATLSFFYLLRTKRTRINGC